MGYLGLDFRGLRGSRRVFLGLEHMGILGNSANACRRVLGRIGTRVPPDDSVFIVDLVVQ